MQFIQGNSNLSLSLSGSNGLTLTGGLAKVLSLPTDSLLQLDGLSLKSGTSAVSKQLIFGADPSGGIRMLGGQTDGGLSMNDGILEYWNNWRGYVSAVSGRLQGIFRFDTRSGYQSEGFVVGGTTTGGTDFMGIGINYDYGDVNIAYYGVGSVAIGTHTVQQGLLERMETLRWRMIFISVETLLLTAQG